MKKIYDIMYGNISEMARGVEVGFADKDKGFQVSPGENYYIFAGGTKPFHAGHDQMINHAITDASKDPNGRVLLFIGLGDRGILKGSDMFNVWKYFIEDYYESISPNIHIEYGGGPVGKVLALLKQANDAAAYGERPDNMFYIYSDPEDTQKYYLMQKFSKRDPSIELKSSPRLYSDKLLGLDPPGVSFMGRDYPQRFTRGGEGGTINISGTKMREYLGNGDVKNFADGLPSWMSNNIKQQVFNMLSGQQLQTEIKRAKKGTPGYSSYLEEIMDELKHIKSEYDSRKKKGARYRKEASKIQDAYSELRRLKRKNEKMLLSKSLQEAHRLTMDGCEVTVKKTHADSFTRDDIKNFILKINK